MRNEPCIICEAYIAGVECENDKCPIFEMKRENKRLQKTVWSLRSQISKMKSDASKMKSDASWDDDIRRGQVQGMW